ncbi:MAG: Hsp70 family protein [Rhodobacteraceae bacterium]|nr:Hsp70 family protein [Paracoccaceae bacterium]
MSIAYGLDFGTSNTVLATSPDGQTAERLVFGEPGDTHSAIASILSFLSTEWGGTQAKPEVGPWAIRQFLEYIGDVRFIQSLKSFVASRHFSGTGVYGRRYDFQDLMSVFLECAFGHLAMPVDPSGARIVVGRPVIFAGSKPDEALAMQRYSEAIARFGFGEVLFVYEPVAAAFSFAHRIQQDATVLVADFGGGTTDYSLMRFSSKAGVLHADPLGHGGIGIAGDTFDYRIVDQVVLPQLGKGSLYKSMGKQLEVPPNLFSNFARWHELSFFKGSDDFKELKKLLRYCLEEDKVELFIELVEEDQGYPLFKAVSEAKAQLSSSEETELRFEPLGSEFKAQIKRADFERWIAGDLAKMEKTLDDTLTEAGVDSAEIDHVFLTGGSSFVPAVRSLFENRFGAQRIKSGEELSSIANGLALIGARDDGPRWAVGGS